jgi:hypothetical protein
MIIQSKLGISEIFNQNDKLENISFITWKKVIWLQHLKKMLSDYKTTDSISSFFDTLQTNRIDNQIWKWFVIFALFLSIETAIIRFMK